ncbi:MAG: APC family permease [Chloroflexi bacterium]|nr:APC family permease [Chloroflexota bacterium]MBK6708983.1 APC family permease [Chloroflexota bacterium]MBK7175848.1 APC family permease [Chloroflexota bacterium]MBK7914763.1 APC family permease [Chloroflexota bacterium]MBP6804132.1 APC family permease [Chloroflexota bacterium]
MSVSYTGIKRALLGTPFPTHNEIHERLDKKRGLAIFASDPISSNAYATEAIMSVLILLGSGALAMTLPIAMGIMTLVLLVIFSYIQTIMHYPDGGGAYTVAKDNLGTYPSLFAAAALLLDYILTVSVSVSAGVRAITSAFPGTYDYRVLMAITAVFILTWINLRGVRESGTIFALPTYAFVGGVLLVVGIGLVRFTGLFGAPDLVPQVHNVAAIQPVSQLLFIWLILRAFAAGCTALTGIEAISNGVQAFKPPESKNAAKTMVAMGVIAMSLFVGITFLATHLNILPSESESVLSQMTRSVAGGGVIYYWVQFFTMMILILAANTGYQDFPRLSSFLAKDGFMPRWMTHRGDRLVYSYGIVVLAFLASLLILVFQADEIAMLPLYALGVMLSFTLSQSGMVLLMGKIGKLKPGESFFTGVTTIHFEKGWPWKRLLNAVGAVTTAVVLIVLIVTKFTEGAWVIVLAVPLLIVFFRSISRHYGNVAESLSTRDLELADVTRPVANVLIVPVADIHRGTLYALQFAKTFSDDVRVISVVTSDQERERLIRRWNRFPEITKDMNLICIDYEYRDILTPLVEYIEKVNSTEFPDEVVTVVIPEFVSESIGSQFLHNQTANFLRFRLRGHKDVAVIDVPYQIS